MDWTALGLTLKLAVSTTTILVLIGVPLAYWLATTRSRVGPLVETVVALPMVLPPTVAGFYFLLATGPDAWIGGGYRSLTGHLLPFSFEGILLASVLFNLPFAVRPFTTAIASVDQKTVEASWCLGVSRLQTFFRIVLPLSWSGILTGLVLSFTHTIGEFGVVLMVGGNIPGVTRTLSVAIYDDVQALNYDSAAWTALLLVVLSFAALSVTYSSGGRRWSV